jgi:hypothetical protein
MIFFPFALVGQSHYYVLKGYGAKHTINYETIAFQLPYAYRHFFIRTNRYL